MNISRRSREYVNRQRRRAEHAFNMHMPEFARHPLHVIRKVLPLNLKFYSDTGAVDSIISAANSVGRILRQKIPEKSLINEILILQLCFAFFVGGLAIVGLWWTSTWAIEDNLKKWG